MSQSEQITYIYMCPSCTSTEISILEILNEWRGDDAYIRAACNNCGHTDELNNFYAEATQKTVKTSTGQKKIVIEVII